MELSTDMRFVTPYLAFELYRINPFKYNFEVEYKRKNFKINRTTIFSFDMFLLMCRFYYTVYTKNLEYGTPFYVYEIKIAYTFRNQRYMKRFEPKNLRDFYECKGQFSRDDTTEFYRSLEGRYADDKDYRYYVFNSGGCNTDLVIVTDYNVRLSNKRMIRILEDLRNKTIFEFHGPRGISVGIHFDYKDDEYAEIVRIN